jgi:glucokinase
MYLGIEIGGTKLQLGVGEGTVTDLAALERLDVRAERGASGILHQIRRAASSLIEQFPVTAIGVGFGGPVDPQTGRVIKSHQVEGWEDVALAQWCQRQFGLPARVGNDCDVAALAEARFGAGAGKSSVFYVTVGTGIGGGFVFREHLYGAGRPAVAEIGHLRPGPQAVGSHETVESLASGLGIASAARKMIERGCEGIDDGDRQDLLRRVHREPERLNAEILAQAAAEGNHLARQVLHNACRVLGWAIGQVVTLLAPDVVVVGGGVSLMGEQLFFTPLRSAVHQYVFPPLDEAYAVVPAVLGEQVVVHGAIALARGRSGNSPQ